MKKITLSVLAALTLAVSITSCKKGEEDPGFTVISRKARVAGTWKITNYEQSSESSITPYLNITSTPVAGTKYQTTNSISHDGSTITTKSTDSRRTGVLATTTVTGSVTEHSFTFEKDGSWKSTRQIKTVTTDTIADFTGTVQRKTTTTTEVATTGTWDFLNGVGKEFKNKERISVATATEDIVITSIVLKTPITSTITSASTEQSISTNNYTYDANKNVEIWNLLQLKNKEMKVAYDFESSSKEKQVFTSSTFNDENKNDDVSTTGKVAMTFTSSK